ncbi:uncharacterized protein LOC110979250 isoform X2 [Acanthaster planci]|uniref:Uncharacterized protein LOC110979250 isoform X2 n=1 Tax=Acanthaster planci TaxID=133434 RepID=A0A8B7YDD8_ACAPL|nr:uncharacterized protein LOC110979250 isoform X2 [Acanthaster planci]
MSTTPSEDTSRHGKKKRKKKRGSSMNRVHPEGSSGDLSPRQNGYIDRQEMAGRNDMGNNNNNSAEISTAADAFNILNNVQKGAERFKGLSCRRRMIRGEQKLGFCNKGKGIDDSIVAEPLKRNRFNEALISYFAQLARSEIEDEVVDLEHVEYLLENGADIRCTDKHGQTVLHEAVRAWETDVASFLLEKGADPNQKDRYGRAPLHIAAAVNYPEMIMLLLDNDADIEILTADENHTPLHFAARNDACAALKALRRMGANLHPRDYKGRTPLQVAAELDRSETAKLLLEMGADASDIDNAGQTALVQLICKMPAVAKEALDQFHRCDRANRKQYYDIHFVEPTKPDDKAPKSRSALQVIVQFHQLELILHPVVQRLMEIKWKKFGWWGAILQVLVNLAFILLWSVIAVTLRPSERMTLPNDIWRIAIWALALLITCYMIGQELQEVYVSKKKFKRWKKWRIGEIEKDLRYCHPQWPQEQQYLRQEIEEINDQGAAYFSEFWNYFDWIVYFLLLVITGLYIASHIITSDEHHISLIAFMRRFMAVSIIPIWLRFMKSARAFKQIGPFIVMLGHIISDILKFGFLYLEFFIPYAFAFWMIFGGRSELPSMRTVDSLLFTLFRLTLVDDYDYDKMHEIDAVMAYILVATFLFLSALLCVNLFIALLSDTFQRVYDNAKSNANMQQASIILGIEESLSQKKLRKYRRFIHEQACPENLYYDDDQTVSGDADLKKVTFQIKDELEEMRESLFSHLNIRGYRRKKRDSLEELREQLTTQPKDDQSSQAKALVTKSIEDQLTQFRIKQERSNRHVQKQLKTINEVLQALLVAHTGGGPGSTPVQPGGGVSSFHNISRPGVLVTLPSIPHNTGEIRGGGDFEEDDYEAGRRPRFVGRHVPLQSTPALGSRARDQREDNLATQRTFLESFRPQAVTPSNATETDGVYKDRLKLFREEQKIKLKKRKQQEDYLQQQQREAQVTLPVSEVSRGQEGHELSELSRQITRESEDLDLVKFSPADKDVEKQEVSDRGSTDA